MTHNLRRMVLAVLVCSCAWFATTAGQEPLPSVQHVADEVIVQFNRTATPSRRDAAIAARGARVVRRLERIGVDRVKLRGGQRLDVEIAALKSNPDVVAVQPNFIREVSAAPNDPYWTGGNLWGLQKIQMLSAWALSTGTREIVVANLDTGVNYNHPDLTANMWRNPGEVAGNGVDDDRNGYVDDVYGIDTYNDDSDPMDDHGHGTHTAGTIGATGNNGVGVVGVNWNVQILPCKFIGSGGTGTDFGAIECFEYITALKQRGVNIRVSSNSWGNPRDTSLPFPQAMKDAIDDAGASGIVNVFAAGNQGTNIDSNPFDPAAFTSPSIVSVAASDSADQRASYSNFGATSVDLAAPGSSILSTRGTGYSSSSGTSMAAPHVAGAAALLAGYKPTLTVAGIKALLTSTVDTLTQWNKVVASGGRLNAFTAMIEAIGDVPPTVALTAPLTGTSFVAPASVTMTATASDIDGSVAKVDFYASGVLVGTDLTSPYWVMWSPSQAGAYALTAVATDDRGFSTTSATANVTVIEAQIPPTARANVALASSGATITASSANGTQYAASYAIDGTRRASLWGNTWADKTVSLYPDWLQVTFAGAKTIDEIDVFSGQTLGSVDPTPTMSSLYAIADFQVQSWNGSQWVTVSGALVTGNQLVWRKFTFSPITTTAVRVNITRNTATLSRIAEIEVYEASTAPPPPPPPPSGRTNVALAANGGIASASTAQSNSYLPNLSNDSKRIATLWSNTWADKTSGVYPDWLRIDFSGAKTITEINVFSGQAAGAEPTATMTSTNAIADFRVEYWTGTQWSLIPNGSVTGNQLVWKQFVFSAITTTAIRVYVTRSGNPLTRIAELEAWEQSTMAGLPLIGFPADNWWNLDISNAPIDPNSANYIAFINNGSTRRVHPDFGGDVTPGSVEIYGMPYVVVDSTVPKRAVEFRYSGESDGVNHTTNLSFPFYPIPDAAITQPHMIGGGFPGNVDRRGIQDRHLILVDKDARHLYELYGVFYDGTKWLASSGAFFDMNTNNRRPDGWTSADAAGLAILPGLVRYDEAFGTEEIRHAFRVTVRATNGYVYPASHRAGSTLGALPMGARLRLKASKNLSGYTPEMQRVFRAMQRYGLIVADNGTDMFVTGTYDNRWDHDILNPAFHSLNASDFEVITLGYK